MKSPVFSAFFQTYAQQRNTQFTPEQFGTLVMFFPALLIIACDGEIDEEELVYLDYLAKSMADSCEETADKQSLQEAYLLELTYLTDHLDTWENPFLDTLNQYLSFNPLVKEDVLDILHLFAEASAGASDEEGKKIEGLRHALSL